MREKILLKTVILLNYILCAYSVQIQDLGGLWVLNDTQNEHFNLKAMVPGGIYTDLQRNKIIGDVFFENNDVDTRWVSKKNWTYFRTFIIQSLDLQNERINLVFEGIDTFSTVLINNRQVGITENMFVEYVFDVKKQLIEGVNNITVIFESPVEKAQKLYEEQLKDHEVKPKCVPDYYRGECHANHIRKMQASFAWDWGPALPSMGIYKDVYLEKFNASRIRYVTVNTNLNAESDEWEIHVKTYLDIDASKINKNGNLDSELKTNENDDNKIKTNEDGNKIKTNEDVNKIKTNEDGNKIKTNEDVNKIKTNEDGNKIKTNEDVNMEIDDNLTRTKNINLDNNNKLTTDENVNLDINNKIKTNGDVNFDVNNNLKTNENANLNINNKLERNGNDNLGINKLKTNKMDVNKRIKRNANLDINNKLKTNENATITLRLHADRNSYVVIYNVNLTQTENNEFIDYQILKIPKLQVSLWWPNGYGKQHLYNFSVSYNNGETSEKDTKNIRIGFRTIELKQDELRTGNAFYFKVNDIPIFAKGSNLIPINILPELGTNKSTIKYLLESAKLVHMNMLRVWGGGIYESNDFYDIADELGILIWQDFMFACSMYPANPKFLQNVKNEVKHQVRRLQHHASIAIWAGNNENEAALRQNWYDTNSNFDVFKMDYIKLYVDLIKPTVLESDNTRQFLISSPTNGLQSEKEGHIAKNPQDEKYGDVHFYNYIVDGWESKIYPIPRFASEYGYQSLPSLNLLKTITNNTSNLNIKSDLFQNRQHHQFGYTEMHLLGQYRLKYPDSKNASKYLNSMVYYGQIIQAMSVKIESEHYRRYKGLFDGNGRGNTMGALYWQLNDVWVAPTWSGIDYNQNWKMLHYFAGKFFAPIIFTYDLTLTRDLSLFVISDLIGNLINLRAQLDVFNYANMSSFHTENFSIPIITNEKAELVTSFWLDKYLTGLGCGELDTAKNNCFLYLSLFDENNMKIAPDNFIFPSALKNSNLPKPNLIVKSVVDKDDGKTFEIVVETNAVSLFVWLETNIKGIFSDNGFLQITPNKTIEFVTESKIDVDTFKNSLDVFNLLDERFTD